MPQLIPIVSEKELVKIPKKEEKPITPLKRPKITMVPPEKMKPPPTKKAIPTGPKPIIPKEDDCCAKVCTILNDSIYDLEQVLSIRREELALRETFIATDIHRKKELIQIIPPGLAADRFGKKIEIAEVIKKESGRKLRLGGADLRKELRVIERRLTTLKDFRYELKEKNSCKCIEDIPITHIPKLSR